MAKLHNIVIIQQKRDPEDTQNGRAPKDFRRLICCFLSFPLHLNSSNCFISPVDSVSNMPARKIVPVEIIVASTKIIGQIMYCDH